MEPEAEKTHLHLTQQKLNRPRANPCYMETEDTESTRYRSGVLARGGRSSLERQEGEVEADWGWASVMAEDQSTLS